METVIIMKSKLIKITRAGIYTITAIALIYDIFVAITKIWDATISHQMWFLGEKFPIVAIAYPLLGSHFFLSKYGKKLFGFLNNWRYVIWISISAYFLVLSIINLFVPIDQIVWMSNNLIFPYLLGSILGLMWYQEK